MSYWENQTTNQSPLPLHKLIEKKTFEDKWNLNLQNTADFSDFLVQRTIGVGGFGRVYHVIHHQSRDFYAMKVLKKESVVRLEHVKRAFFEKRILQSITHPFLVHLHFVLKTNSYLCFVMPLIRGGEIYSYLQKPRPSPSVTATPTTITPGAAAAAAEKTKVPLAATAAANATTFFTEQQTKFYAAQMVLALEYLHDMGIVYRDLKPENVLLECDGYVKLTDFGFAKRLPPDNRLTHSFVGTPQYMAPEMLVRELRERGYGCGVDWWCFGVFVYEMATGMPPFTGDCLLQVFDRILKRNYKPPTECESGLADLLEKLFQIDAAERLGCKGRGVEELKQHEWFADISWRRMLRKEVKPEFLPKCVAEDPTLNFEQYQELPVEDGSVEEFADVFRDF